MRYVRWGFSKKEKEKAEPDITVPAIHRYAVAKFGAYDI
jgi:hypothetical protein